VEIGERGEGGKIEKRKAKSEKRKAKSEKRKARPVKCERVATIPRLRTKRAPVGMTDGLAGSRVVELKEGFAAEKRLQVGWLI